MRFKSFKNAGETALLRYADCNRTPDPIRAKRIANDIINGKAEFLPPIIVGVTEDRALYVLDGQHRLEAMKIAWAEGSKQELLCLYVDCPLSKVRETIINMNNRATSKTWTNRQYAESLYKIGNKDMIALYEFARFEDHNRDWRLLTKGLGTNKEALSLRNLGFIVFGRNIDKEIMDGTITVTSEQLTEAHVIYDEIQQIIKKLGFSVNNWTSGMIQGWRLVRQSKLTGPMLDEIGFTAFLKLFKRKGRFTKNLLTKFGYKAWQSEFEHAILKIHSEIKAA